MADLTLTSIPPTAAVPGVQGGAAANPGGGAPAASVPSLPAGTLIQGFVLNRDAGGNPILRTASGDFLIHSDMFLKIGSDVVARVNGSGSSINASILSVDGHSPQETALPLADALISDDAAAQPATPQAGSTTDAATAQSTATAAASPAVLRAAPATLTGTLTAPAPQSAQNAAPLPAGTQLTFQVVSVAPAETPVAPEAPPAAPATAETVTAAAPGAPVSAPPAAPAAPPTGAATQQYSAYTRSAALTVEAPLPPGETPPANTATESPAQAPAATAAAPTPPPAVGTPAQPTVQAQVTIPSAPGAPTTVQTPLGTVQLENAPALPAGSKLTLALLQTAPPIASALQADAPASAAATLSGGWQSLGQVLDTLGQIDEGSAAHFARMIMPASAFGAEPTADNLYPSPRDFSAGLSFLMNALSSGNFRGWIGSHTADLLEAHGHTPLLDQAESEFAAMRTLYADVKPQTWQALFVPIMAEGQVKTLRLFTKRGRKGKEHGKKAQGDTRFILELELSSTGQLQLDGLVKKRETATQFDLMIRSRTPFSQQEQNDIHILYAAIGEATGYSGVVMFQQVNEFTIRPMDEMIAEQHKDVTA